MDSDTLDDLSSRFIINIPREERDNFIRICFQIELAHWFYLDFYCDNKIHQTCGFQQFAHQIFQHIPFLRKHADNVDSILMKWKEYKMSVPTYGAILITADKKNVLLVQSYCSKSSWGFPKGKVNENEDPEDCAIREVLEETGFDISKLLIPFAYIDNNYNDQYTRLYLINNVPYDTIFKPKTRCEIRTCQWFPIEFLPSSKIDNISKVKLGITTNSFFMIIPFIQSIKRYLFDGQIPIRVQHSYYGATPPIQMSNKKHNSPNFFPYYNNNNTPNGKRQRHKSAGDLDGSAPSNRQQNYNIKDNTNHLKNKESSTSQNIKRKLFNFSEEKQYQPQSSRQLRHNQQQQQQAPQPPSAQLQQSPDHQLLHKLQQLQQQISIQQNLQHQQRYQQVNQLYKNIQQQNTQDLKLNKSLNENSDNYAIRKAQQQPKKYVSVDKSLKSSNGVTKHEKENEQVMKPSSINDVNQIQLIFKPVKQPWVIKTFDEVIKNDEFLSKIEPFKFDVNKIFEAIRK